MIAQCLSYGSYRAVHVPADKDVSVKEYLRMRDDHNVALKKIKQQINAFCLRHGYFYAGNKWTIKHLDWMTNSFTPAGLSDFCMHSGSRL